MKRPEGKFPELPVVEIDETEQKGKHSRAPPIALCKDRLQLVSCATKGLIYESLKIITKACEYQTTQECLKFHLRVNIMWRQPFKKTPGFHPKSSKGVTSFAV